MNAVEIEEAVSKLCDAPFDVAGFPYEFLQAFGLNQAGASKLRSGGFNKSDCGGVLQRQKNNIHIKACPPGEVSQALSELRTSPATAKHKARFILATDGQTIQAERFDDGEVLACEFKELPNRFTFFLPLAGISTVKRIDENAFDIRATGRLNKLYIELLRINPDWDTEARRQDLNHFFARLIFCFFAEDTSIFIGEQLFTKTIEQMTERNGSNVHIVLGEIFRAMDIRPGDREAAKTRPYADSFPYVNGNLFGGSTDSPKFNQSARNYLIFVGNLDWKFINPDIFGSMIQAVADDEERGALGMHYTSVPNILKVLNPLFLDDLRAKLQEAGDGSTPASKGQLKRLRDRIARIRVFDPACGSGNFLVIAYKEMRGIEAEINQRRGEHQRASEIPISNFRGIELRHFPAEIARLALIIAEYQCNVLYSGELFARAEFLPLDAGNWITCGNALEVDWLSVCPPTGTGVKLTGDDLFNTPKDQAEIDFEYNGGETYTCGNPPYVGRRNQTEAQKAEIKAVLGSRMRSSASLDYVFCWIAKAVDFVLATPGAFALVTTNSVSQGTQVAIFWPFVLRTGLTINFAYRSFRWSNNAANNAGVTCVIIGVGRSTPTRLIFEGESVQAVKYINPYLLAADPVMVEKTEHSLSSLPLMLYGNMPADGNHLMLTPNERDEIVSTNPEAHPLMNRVYGANELLQGAVRYCLWIGDEVLASALSIPTIRQRIARVREVRANGADTYRSLVGRPHQFATRRVANAVTVLVPTICSESREYFPAVALPGGTATNNQAYALFDPPLWTVSLLASRLHLVWIATVCGKLETRIRYSNTLGWNTFPVPTLTDENKAALTRCAEDILLAREAHFPATIAEMYDPEAMDTKYPNLRAAHERNDETLERIYIGRRFRNDTERLEKLFAMYTEMTAKAGKSAQPKGTSGRAKK